MNLLISQFSDLVGWTGTNIPFISSDLDKAADDSPAAIALRFTSTGSEVYNYAPTTPIDISAYDYIVINCAGSLFNNNPAESFNKRFEITFNGTDQYSFDAPLGKISQVVLRGISSISSISIRCNGGVDEILHLTNTYAVKDELPVDIFRSLQSRFERELQRILVGSGVNTQSSDQSITLPVALDYVEQYALIDIEVPGTTVRKYVKNMSREANNYVYHFGNLYGSTVGADLTNANVYLVPFVSFGRANYDVIVPSVVIWGLAGNVQFISSDVALHYDSFINDHCNVTRWGQTVYWNLIVDIISNQDSLIADWSTNLRNILFDGKLWVNGFDLDIEYYADAREIGRQALSLTNKVQYSVRVTLREDTWPRTLIPKTTLQKSSVSIS